MDGLLCQAEEEWEEAVSETQVETGPGRCPRCGLPIDDHGGPGANDTYAAKSCSWRPGR